MDFEVLRKRVQDEHSVRAQREAAEKKIPSERPRREIREACARENAHRGREEHPAASEPDTHEPPDTSARLGRP